jgi:hypothetical protein
MYVNSNSKSNLNLIAQVLYNHYYYFVWIAGLILLLAMVGALALTIEGMVYKFLENYNIHMLLQNVWIHVFYFEGQKIVINNKN